MIAAPTRIRQVFCNLLQNAANFAPKGSEISVCSRNLDETGVAIDFTDPDSGRMGLSPSPPGWSRDRDRAGDIAEYFQPF